MKYFKNTELAKLYHVSEKSVRNWIQAASDGKLDLELHQEKDKFLVANTSKNAETIEGLVAKGKKYKNTRGFRVLTPKQEFYDTYTRKQILDIISSLTIHREIPLQYGYANGGATSWNDYTNRLVEEEASNILTTTTNLMRVAEPNIDQLIPEKSTVNVVDLGPGTGWAARPTLERLHKQGRLGRYIAIDISQDMLDILESNVREWFDGKVKFEGYVRDFSYERFDDLLIDENIDGKNNHLNMVFLFGGTLNNFRFPNQILQVISNSLGLNDLFFYSGYLDTPKTRRYFDLPPTDSAKETYQPSNLMPALWQIDESLGSIEYHYSERRHCRIKELVPKVDLSVRIDFGPKSRFLEFRKGEPIVLWRHWHFNAIELARLFEDNGFSLMQVTKSKDQNYVLVVSKVKTSNQ